MSEPDVSDLLTVAEATAIIDAFPLAARVSAGKRRYFGGQVLAEDVRADRDYPPFDKSQMDGYAVRAADVTDGAELRVVGEVAAGNASPLTLAAGQAIAVMTGAPIPAGADGVVPVEDVTVVGDRIRVRGTVTLGRYIARRGSDCPAGTVVLTAGTRIGPAQQAVLASVGAQGRIYEDVQVAVLTTGNEVVSSDVAPGPAQIRDSNGIMLMDLLPHLGGNVNGWVHAEDEPDAIRVAIEAQLASADVLFVTGGMSMGKYDFVPQVLRGLGFDFHITKLRIKPGKPFVFASKQGKVVFGLPGNPVSAFVCTLRLASRLIARMGGEPVRERWIDAELESPLPANGPREFYQPAVLIRSAHRTQARPLQWKGSADVFTLARADALLVRSENAPQQPAGSRVQLLEVPR